MKETSTKTNRSRLGESQSETKFIVTVLLGFIVGAAIPLSRVSVGDGGEIQTPLGYTYSLVLWAIPCVSILVWFERNKPKGFQKRAFWTTTFGLLIVSFVLEYFWGTSFFEFENHNAVLGIKLPAFRGWIPIEEYVFYVGGFLCILLLYIWCDESWLSAYNVPDYDQLRRELGIEHVLSFHPASLWVGAAMLGAATLYKRFGAEPPYQDGFPGYLAYIIVVSIVPSVALFKSVQAFINWRAFSLTLCTLLLISLLWEVTLGVRFDWWNYQPRYMTGWRITAWWNLPIEAVIVWFAAGFTTVVFYEGVKLWQAMGLPMARRTPAVVQRGLEKLYSHSSAEE